MIYIYFFIFYSFLTLICTAETIDKGPFSGINISILSKKNAKIIKEANEDYLLVKNGKKPKNAKIDTTAAFPGDGGTTYYKGNGYELTILKSLSSFGKLNGFVYGPIIVFNKKIASGNSNKVEFLRFYTMKQLKKLMKE